MLGLDDCFHPHWSQLRWEQNTESAASIVTANRRTDNEKLANGSQKQGSM